MTRSGQPGRTVMVGWTLRLRSTRRWPARLVVDCVDCCSALTRSLSLEPKASSLPTPEHGGERHAVQELPGVEVDEIGVATGQRQRTVGGAQGCQLRQPDLRRDGSWFRERNGNRLLLGGLLGCGFELQPEEHAGLERLAGHAGEAGLFGAVGIGEEVRAGGTGNGTPGLMTGGSIPGASLFLSGLTPS